MAEEKVEQVLVVPRAAFEGVGGFQGFRGGVEGYLEAFFAPGQSCFLDRPAAEEDPTYKQLIPYAVFRHGGKVLHYVRGGSSGEKRLVAKGSIGVGGHINREDLQGEEFGEGAYHRAVRREIAEELRLGGAFTEKIVGMINDDSVEVGKVHLGIVHLVDLDSPVVEPGEEALASIEFLEVAALRERSGQLETWSRILVENWESLE